MRPFHYFIWIFLIFKPLLGFYDIWNQLNSFSVNKNRKRAKFEFWLRCLYLQRENTYLRPLSVFTPFFKNRPATKSFFDHKKSKNQFLSPLSWLIQKSTIVLQSMLSSAGVDQVFYIIFSSVLNCLNKPIIHSIDQLGYLMEKGSD